MNNELISCKENDPSVAGRHNMGDLQKVHMDSFDETAMPDPSSPPVAKTNHNYSEEQSSSKNEPKEDTKKDWVITDFKLLSVLGQDKFGKIYLGREINTSNLVVLKQLALKLIVRSVSEIYVLQEMENQCQLRHPNILRMYGYFDDRKNIYLVLEYAEHASLSKLLKQRGRFDEKTAAFYIREVTKALIYCHDKKVIHREIKPNNLLIGSNLQLLVANFGLSVNVRQSRRITACGTPDYWSPEMVEGELYSYELDIWCLGVLCYEFITGFQPFYHQDAIQTFNNIKTINITYPDYVSEKAKNLIGKLLVIDTEKRLPLQNVLQHDWITENALEGALPPVINLE